jgi:hypothetical protein
MRKIRQAICRIAGPAVNLGPLKHACRVLDTRVSQGTAERLGRAVQQVWNQVCRHLLLTHDRDDRIVRDFESILEVCYLKLRKLSFRPCGSIYRRHADQLAVYLGLVRRFRREGVAGISHGVVDTLLWQQCRHD